jgi:hypothetical protein
MVGVGLGFVVWAGSTWAIGPRAAATRQTFLPVVRKPAPATSTPVPTATPALSCHAIPGQSYGTLTINGSPSDRPAEQHADLNLALRAYTYAPGETPVLSNDCAETPDDPCAPQLRGLFADHRVPTFLSMYWVYKWDWTCNCRLAQFETLCGPALVKVAVTPDEVLYVPDSCYRIDPAGYEVLVLYATETRITLKYTREDNVLVGYTLHLEDICVDPNLLALYRAMDAQGRGRLPALFPRQPFGHAKAMPVGIVIRDSGNWMNPRSCKDWWRTP